MVVGHTCELVRQHPSCNRNPGWLRASSCVGTRLRSAGEGVLLQKASWRDCAAACRSSGSPPARAKCASPPCLPRPLAPVAAPDREAGIRHGTTR
eukprot:1685881-Rhodomonas_salina.2